MYEKSEIIFITLSLVESVFTSSWLLEQDDHQQGGGRRAEHSRQTAEWINKWNDVVCCLTMVFIKLLSVTYTIIYNTLR